MGAHEACRHQQVDPQGVDYHVRLEIHWASFLLSSDCGSLRTGATTLLASPAYLRDGSVEKIGGLVKNPAVKTV